MNGRSVLVGWLGLIVLYTVVTSSAAVAGVLGPIGTAARRLSDPSVPLIPDKRK